MSYNQLNHHGIKGQKWGVRRFQNEDGSLTPRGKTRLLAKDEKYFKKHVDNKMVKGEKILQKQMKNNKNMTQKEIADFFTNTMNSLTKDLKTPSGSSIKWIHEIIDENYTYHAFKLKGGMFGDKED